MKWPAARVLIPRTLGGRLVLALAGFGGLITAVVVTADFRLGRDRILLETERALDDRAREASGRVEEGMLDRLRAIAIWPDLEAAQDLTTDDVDKRLSLTLQQLVRNLGAHDYAVGIDPMGRVVAASRANLIGTSLGELAGAPNATDTPPFTFVPADSSTGQRARFVVANDVWLRGTERFIGRLVLVSDWKDLVRSDLSGSAAALLEMRDAAGRVVFAGDQVAAAEREGVVRGRHVSHVFESYPFTVTIAAPQRTALEPVRRARLASIVLAAALIAVIVPAAVLVAGGATHALRTLTSAAREATGDVPPRFTLDEAGTAPEEVRVLNDALDRMVERLERSRHELAAQETLASLGTMAAALAHEIRTPLGVLRGSLALLSRPGADDARRAELREMVETEVGRLERLVDELLAFARPRAPERDRGDLADLCRRIRPLLDAQCSARGVALELALDPAPSMFDDDQIKQVVLNLVANAVQATSGGGRVVVRTRANGDGATLEVTDTGAGIPPEMRERVWQPFVTTRRAGTGLGLPIVRRIVEAHGGRIALDSEPGHGTSVRVTLPDGAAA